MKVDAQIGEFLDGLKKDGVADDTIVFYYGDHGGVLPRGKGYAYESGLNVPLVVYAPPKWRHLLPAKAGSRTEAFVSFIDFGPTVLNLAGAIVPSGMDGKPFLGNGVTSRDLAQRDEVFGYADRFDEKYDLVRTYRKGRYKYIRNYQPFNFDGLFNEYRYRMLAYKDWKARYDAGQLNAVQRQFFESRPAEALYDIESDPHETRNLAGDPKFEDVVSDLRQRLTAQVKSMPDLSFIPEPDMVSDALANPVAYGQAHKDRIGGLIDTANLSLLTFEEAKSGIKAALSSSDPHQRYWGLIVCSSFGEEAAAFYKIAKRIASSDDSNLARVRAAEFLGLAGVQEPQETIYEALAKSKSLVEANLILNTATLLRDGPRGYAFKLDREIFPAEWREDARSNVNRRADYFDGKFD